MDYTNTMNAGGRAPAPAVGLYRPRLEFFHQNMKGTGSALSMELHPAHDNVSGCIMLKMANQASVADRRGPSPTFARFDWEHAVCVKLDFSDLSQILQVLRGECEAVGPEGRGLYHKSPTGSARISFRHVTEPTSAFTLGLNKVCANGGELSSFFVLNAAEARGFCTALEGVMAIVAFGIPMLVARNTSEYREKAREVARATPAA